MTTDNPNNTGPHLDPQAMVGFLVSLREHGLNSIYAANAFLVLASHPKGLRTTEVDPLIHSNSVATTSFTLQKLGKEGLVYYVCTPRCTTWHLTETGWAIADRFLNLYPTQA